MNWLLEAAMRARTGDLIEAKGADLPDDGGRRFRNPKPPPVDKRLAGSVDGTGRTCLRLGNVFHRKTKPVQLQMEITWPEHHAA